MAIGINDYGGGYNTQLENERRRRALLGQLVAGEPAPGSFTPGPDTGGAPTGGTLPPSAPPKNNPPARPPAINDWSPNTPAPVAPTPAPAATPAPTPGPTPVGVGRDPWFGQNPFPDGGTREQQDAWRAEAAKHNGGGAPVPGPAGGGWDRNRIAQYFASRGVEPFPTSLDSWERYWNEWGKNDPAYFEQRLAQADEFTGKGPNYNWQAAGQPDPGTTAAPSGPPVGPSPTGAPAAAPSGPPVGPSPTGAPAAAGPAYPPELGQFYAAQTEAIRKQQERDAQVQATMRNALLNLMNQGQQPVDLANDPGAAAYRNAQWREQRKGREALAERAAFLGLNSGGQGSGSFETSLQGQRQDTQNAIADYEAKRTTDELNNRRQMLVQGLQIANALGARTEASSLQRELAMIDAQLRQAQLGFNYAQLGQNQGQFEDTMGFNYANLLSGLNRNSYLDLMNQ